MKQANRVIVFIQAAGFSLVELLLAVGLGSFLLVIISRYYLAANQITHSQEQLSCLEDNLQLAHFLLWSQIMQAGSAYNGALSTDRQNKLARVSPLWQTGIYGYSSHQAAANGLGNKVVAGTDVIEIVKSSSLEPNRLEKITFFVGKTNYETGKAKQDTALYQLVDDRDSVELVPGVVAMKIGYLPHSAIQSPPLTAEEVNRLGKWDQIKIVVIDLQLKCRQLEQQERIYIRLRARG